MANPEHPKPIRVRICWEDGGTQTIGDFVWMTYEVSARTTLACSIDSRTRASYTNIETGAQNPNQLSHRTVANELLFVCRAMGDKPPIEFRDREPVTPCDNARYFRHVRDVSERIGIDDQEVSA